MIQAEEFLPQITSFLDEHKISLNVLLECSHSKEHSATYFDYIVQMIDVATEKPMQEQVLKGNLVFTFIEHELYGETPCVAQILFDFFHSIYAIDHFPHQEAWIEAHGLLIEDEGMQLRYEIFTEKNNQIKKFFSKKEYNDASLLAYEFFEKMRISFTSNETEAETDF